MAIAFVDSEKFLNAGSGVSTRTCSYTVGAGSNLLVVGIYSSALTGLTWNGSAMTKIGEAFFNSLELWYILAPTTGTHDMVATSTTTFVFNPAIFIADYSGVNAFDAFTAQEDGGTNSATIAVTTVADNCWAVMVAMGDNGGDVAAGTGCTLRETNGGVNPNIGGYLDSNTLITPAGSYSMTYTGSGHMYAVAASFSPASGGGGGGVSGTGLLSLLGVGN